MHSSKVQHGQLALLERVMFDLSDKLNISRISQCGDDVWELCIARQNKTDEYVQFEQIRSLLDAIYEDLDDDNYSLDVLPASVIEYNPDDEDEENADILPTDKYLLYICSKY